MSLPDVVFTNNLGTVTFPRCLIGINDEWVWNGASVKRVKSISLSGHMNRQADVADREAFDRLESTGLKGQRGSLQVPWGVLTNVAIEDADVPQGIWDYGVPYTVNFTDDNPDDNLYTIRYFGLKLHTPKVSLPLYDRKISDDHTQIPFQSGDAIDWDDLRMLTLRRRNNVGSSSLTIEGTVLLDESPGLDTDGHVVAASVASLAQRISYISDVLSMRSGTSDVTAGLGPSPGMPAVFDFATACPEVGPSGVDVRDAIVRSSRGQWDVENNTVRVQAQIVCQPQDWF